jgi:outer membrane protein assembly factor BamB
MLAAGSLVLGWGLLVGSIGAQDWPQWRRPGRDSKVTGFTVPTTWPKALTEKWKRDVGIGESSPVLVGDKVYAFGRLGGDEVTSCLDAATGKVLWQDKYPTAAVKGPAAKYSGTRSTPAVADGKVCTLGVNGVVSCLDAATGKILWRQDTKAKPKFYTSSSPLIVDGMVIIYVGALTAFDLANGDVKWQWKGGETPYGSPVLATIDGTRQVVTPTWGSVVGVGLMDGNLLWQHKIAGSGYAPTYGTPIIEGNTVIYAAPGGRGGGGSMVAFQVDKKGDGFTTRELWKTSQVPYQYNTPVLKGGLLFGLSSAKTFFCMDAKTGKILWTDKTQRGEAGGVLNAGNVLLALTGDSELVAFEASPKGYTEIAKYRVAATPGLAYPIISGHRVFVKGRNALSMWTMN